ncbi:MAG: hypothetical protein IJE14_09905 [Clostridia bacterium]|nr:hypothetical protein [Clostridia bacterium]
MYLILNKKFKKGLIAAAIAVPIIIIAVVIACVINGNSVCKLSRAGIEDNGAVTLISHRGLNKLAPENTLEAAAKSAEYGYGYVEFDIRRTKDGMWVLMHDEDIDRMTDGEGKVGDLTYKQIISCRIDEGKNLKDALSYVITVPTLEQMLAVCSEKSLKPVIEIKDGGTEHIPELLNFIAARRNTDMMIISFDREQIEYISTLISTGKTTFIQETVELYWLTNNLDGETLETAAKTPEIGVSFNGNKAGTQKEIDAFTEKGIKLACWTIDSPSKLEKLYERGITTFTTNRIVYNTAEE